MITHTLCPWGSLFSHCCINDLFCSCNKMLCEYSSNKILNPSLYCCIFLYRFTFPSVFIVYSPLPVAVFELLLLIGYFDRKKLFCTSIDLEESVANPTTFCTLQGIYHRKHSIAILTKCMGCWLFPMHKHIITCLIISQHS